MNAMLKNKKKIFTLAADDWALDEILFSNCLYFGDEEFAGMNIKTEFNIGITLSCRFMHQHLPGPEKAV